MKNAGKKFEEITLERLYEVSFYDPISGKFTSRINRRGVRAGVGGELGSKRKDGYIRFTIDGKSYLASRLAYLYMEGYFPENDVDHIDRDTSNNKWSNLRHVSRSCNMKNGNLRKVNTSGITGVSFYKKTSKWEAHISTPNGKKHLGLFVKKIDAAMARFNAEKEYGYSKCNNSSSAYLYLLKMEQL